MSIALVSAGYTLAARIRDHLLDQVERVPLQRQPFAHFYLEEVFPPDLYADLLHHLPGPEQYPHISDRYRGQGEGDYARSAFALTPEHLAGLPAPARALWGAVAEALTAPALKEAVYARLAPDLAYRYGISENEVPQLAGHARPTLYRETEGFEIPPHPDTRRKVVTMHLYLPADHSQLDLGTALYRRRLLAWPVGNWRRRFIKVKQFPFQPNSGYAFAVTNTLRRKSWHGRERLPAGAGVRNTLLNTFYESPTD